MKHHRLHSLSSSSSSYSASHLPFLFRFLLLNLAPSLAQLICRNFHSGLTLRNNGQQERLRHTSSGGSLTREQQREATKFACSSIGSSLSALFLPLALAPSISVFRRPYLCQCTQLAAMLSHTPASAALPFARVPPLTTSETRRTNFRNSFTNLTDATLAAAPPFS